MAGVISAEYARVEAEAGRLLHSDAQQRRIQARLRRELHRIAARDHFPTRARERATRAVEAMAQPGVAVP